MRAEQAAVYEPLATPAGAWAAEHLASDVVGWLTTVAPDGRVQSSPISFLWDGKSILFYSKPATPKLRNIAAHPQVSFNLNSDPYADHILVIEGIAAVDDSAPAVGRPPDLRGQVPRPAGALEDGRGSDGSRVLGAGPDHARPHQGRVEAVAGADGPEPAAALEHPPRRQAHERVASAASLRGPSRRSSRG